jgi:hypothetical protein
VAEVSFQEFQVAGWDTVRLGEKGRDEGRRSEQVDEFVTRMPVPEVNARAHGRKKGLEPITSSKLICKDRSLCRTPGTKTFFPFLSGIRFSIFMGIDLMPMTCAFGSRL